MPASNSKFIGNVPDFISAQRIKSLGLKAINIEGHLQGMRILINEWRDSEGNLYFYSIREFRENHKTSVEEREFRKLYYEVMLA